MLTRRRSFVILSFCFLILFSFSSINAADDYIVAKINNIAITKSELQSRLKIFNKLSGFKVGSASEKKALTEALLSKMVEEEIIRQDAIKSGLVASYPEMQNAIEIVALSKKMEVKKLTDFLQLNPIINSAFRAQIESEILWSKIVSQRLSAAITVSDFEVNQMLKRADLISKQKRFKLAEINLKEIDSGDLLPKKIYDELQDGVNFDEIARTFSQNYDSNQGLLGWVDKSQINEKIYQAIEDLEVGQYSQPIKLGQSYRIFKLLDTKITDKIDKGDIKRIKDYITNKKLRVKAKSYMMNLKRRAFVEMLVN